MNLSTNPLRFPNDEIVFGSEAVPVFARGVLL